MAHNIQWSGLNRLDTRPGWRTESRGVLIANTRPLTQGVGRPLMRLDHVCTRISTGIYVLISGRDRWRSPEDLSEENFPIVRAFKTAELSSKLQKTPCPDSNIQVVSKKLGFWLETNGLSQAIAAPSLQIQTFYTSDPNRVIYLWIIMLVFKLIGPDFLQCVILQDQTATRKHQLYFCRSQTLLDSLFLSRIK